MNLNYLYLILAIILLFSGHLLRILRWEIFIKIYEKPDKKSLMISLSSGYLCDFVLPFHLGEIIRALIAGKKMKNGYSFSFATVIIDRYLDMIFVGLIFVGILLFGGFDPVIAKTSGIYVAACLGLVIISIIIFACSKAVKTITRLIASIFNENIEYHILGFVFSAINGFKDLFLHLSKLKVFATTAFMWFSYLLSYYFFAAFEEKMNSESSLLSVFLDLFGSFNISRILNGITKYSIHMFVFLCCPLMLLFIASAFVKQSIEDNESINILPQLRREERLKFLEEYFANNKREYLSDYLEINRNVAILRDYSAGSLASTMLCAENDNTFYRKFAFGDAKDKLIEQKEWMDKHPELKLPKIINSSVVGNSFLYDMSYVSGVMTLFQYAHADTEKCFLMIKTLIDDLGTTIYTNGIAADVEKYIESKVNNNIENLKKNRKFQKLYEYDTVIINGKEYKNIKHYDKILNKDYLINVLKKDSMSEGHGDLTFENIIVKSDGEYYFIDPNPNQDVSGRNCDLGKLLQSLHSGYEFRRMVSSCEVKGNHIEYFFSMSHAYHELYGRFSEYLKQNYLESDIRSIYAHELVHYLRLLPYRVGANNFAVFYAAFLEILSDYEKEFGDLDA